MLKEDSIFNYTQIMFLDKYLQLTNGMIAGGCFKNIFSNQKVKDIDIFFKSSIDYLNAKKQIEETKDEFVKVFENDNVIRFKDKFNDNNIELVKKSFYESPKKLLESFDFTITKFCYYKVKEFDEYEEYVIKDKVLIHEDYFKHLYLKRLVIDNDVLLFPHSTLNRMFSYIKYGYNPCIETKIKIIKFIQTSSTEIDINRSLYDGLD